MEVNYRYAKEQDIPFIAETIIQAEKSGTEIVITCKLFNITEQEYRNFLYKVLKEDIADYEYSLSQFMIAESENKPIGAYLAWIEGQSGLPSSIIKMSSYKAFLRPEGLDFLSSNRVLVNEMGFNRENGTMQYESLYIVPDFRGKGIGKELSERLMKDIQNKNPEVSKAQLQLLTSNIVSLHGQLKNGFIISDSTTCLLDNVLEFYPGNKKVLMEKRMNNGNKY